MRRDEPQSEPQLVLIEDGAVVACSDSAGFEAPGQAIRGTGSTLYVSYPLRTE